MRKQSKNLASRIAQLEAHIAPTKHEVIYWSDNSEEELDSFLARKRSETGFDGEYIVFIGVSGRWVEGDGKSRWERPPRAAARYAKWGNYAPPRGADAAPASARVRT